MLNHDGEVSFGQDADIPSLMTYHTGGKILRPHTGKGWTEIHLLGSLFGFTTFGFFSFSQQMLQYGTDHKANFCTRNLSFEWRKF